MDEFENKYFTADTAPSRTLALPCAPEAVPVCTARGQLMHNILTPN